jgi:hypothetical protein
MKPNGKLKMESDDIHKLSFIRFVIVLLFINDKAEAERR